MPGDCTGALQYMYDVPQLPKCSESPMLSAISETHYGALAGRMRGRHRLSVPAIVYHRRGTKYMSSYAPRAPKHLSAP
jgi:hypothetical protein